MNLSGGPVLVVEGGYTGWRAQALRALAAGWPPESLTWQDRGSAASILAEQGLLDYAMAPKGGPAYGPASESESGLATSLTAEPAPAIGISSADAAHRDATREPTFRISRPLAELLQDAALYRAPERWALLYRVLWRWQQGDRTVASAADEDGSRLHAMAKTVRRAKHDMIAYVRFRRREGDESPQYLAWYEPEHDVLAYAAEHFADRMGRTSWCIGTPHGAALWDGNALKLTDEPADAHAMRRGAEADQAEPLWLLYYKSIFNPARLNETALVQRMPVRFWKNLPEGPLISGMIVEARNGARRVGQVSAVGAMAGKAIAVEADQALPERATPSSLDLCRRCELWRHATQPVPGQGPASARLMLVGEQPGDHEDLSGQVFVGPAGQVLDQALQRAGVRREAVFLTNAVKHFKWVPRGKLRLHKTPGQQEVEACAHWLEQEVASVRPAVIVTLGATALGAMLGRKARLQDHLGQPVRLGEAWVVATWHPAHALRVGGVAESEAVRADIAQALALGQRLAAGG